MLAMDVNDNARHLKDRVVQKFFASMLAPTGGLNSMMVDRLRFHTLPSGAARAYLRGEWSASHLHFKRLRASVTAKQNGFWQIVH
ncbi:hypothetical protein ACQKP5_24610 [Pseudomonas vancouverensis]|uniref:hypothetical protein n=1 Tax=Pseudomonas vancouverensis TaxID=95300 RepID=UPI003CFF52AF